MCVTSGWGLYGVCEGCGQTGGAVPALGGAGGARRSALGVVPRVAKRTSSREDAATATGRAYARVDTVHLPITETQAHRTWLFKHILSNNHCIHSNKDVTVNLKSNQKMLFNFGIGKAFMNVKTTGDSENKSVIEKNR